LQFNFYDHSKLILSSRGLVVTYINKDSQLSTWSLDELLRPEGLGHDRKVIDSIVKKVKYVKVLLGTIRSTSAAPAASSASSAAAAVDTAGAPPAAHRTPTLIR
jgi:ribosomal protein L12E/L44/L45/RPP1/RPP2